MTSRYLICLFFFFLASICLAKSPSNPAFKSTSHTAFIENKGQIIDQHNNPNPSVFYLLNSPGFNVQLRKTGFSYDLYTATGLRPQATGYKPKPEACGLKPEACSIEYHRIDFDLLNANLNPVIETSDPSPDYFNYFTASAPTEGIKNVRQYKNITYKNIYPGIDLEFLANNDHGFKYNFIIHHGGNIKDIRLKITGPQNISFSKDLLKFTTSLGDVEELIPECYYIVNNSRVAVKAGFKKINHDVYGFSSDRILPENSSLVIDPTPIRLWGTYYGGDTIDQFGGCATDKAGNVFLYGNTYSPNNIASSGSFQGTLAGLTDCFLAKFDAAGQRQWGTYFGGTSFEQIGDGLSVAVDNRGNIYFTGSTTSTSGISTPGAHQTLYGGGFLDCFLEKFNTAGNRLWGTYYGGANGDNAGGIATDKNGNVFLAGYTHSDTGIATPGSYQPNRYNSNLDAFLAKFDSNGVRQWGTYYGGEMDEFATSCVTDSLGNVYFVGNTTSQINIASPGAFQTLYGGGGEDAFLAKFTTGGQRVWATYYGGENDDDGFGCAADSAGNVCLTGSTKSINGIASTGCFDSIYRGGYDAYIVKFNSLGQRSWGTYFGGTTYDIGSSCAFGSDHDVFLIGLTESGNFISTPDAYQTSLGGSVDGYIAKFNDAGQRLWATYYGGTGVDNFYTCSYVKDDTLYIAGDASSTNNIASPGAWQQVYGGGASDCILIKFLDCWPIDTAGPISGPASVCKPSTGLNYSIPLLAHAVNYVWTLPPGYTISSGAGTAHITIDISVSAGSGTIRVKGLNKCGNPGDSASLFISIAQAPVPAISGPDTTCMGPGNVYSTASGKTNYQWTTSAGGMITSGGTNTDNTATVTWNTAGTQHVYVNYTDANGCHAPTPTDFHVLVNPVLPVSLSISASANPFCQGSIITFTAAPANGGTTPSYQWKVNGGNVGFDNPMYSYVPNFGDVVTCVLNSSIACPTGNPATSNSITMVENTNVVVSVTISPSANPVCSGTSVTFQAIPVNGGTTPVYQWKVNGIIVGANNPVYSYVPVNGDVIICILTSNAVCASGNPATSNTVTMIVNPNLPVSISISASANPVCAGALVTFTSATMYGGTTPFYQWKVNGLNTGTNSSSYSYNPAPGDLVSCILTSNATCPTGNPATSNTIIMTVNPNLTVSITITASANPVCSGIAVTYTAATMYGGPTPLYQWKVNGIIAGTNSSTYTYNPVTGDQILCILTSSIACPIGNPATSNIITMNVPASPVATFTLCNDSITTTNAQPFKLKGGIPLGGTYSGAGVTNGIFYPAIAGIGDHQINYTYTNAALCSVTVHRSLITISPAPFTCGNPVTDIRDNKDYPTVQIGNQCWMASNLNYGTMIPGNTSQMDNCVPEKYCYNDLTANCGLLTANYQWDELMQYEDTPAKQGLCPPGWHIPTEVDWNTLFATYINNAFAASPLKYSGFSGFNALLAGTRYMNKSWDLQGFATFFWSSTAHGTDKAWAHGMNDDDPSVSAYPSLRNNAFSVRCLKD